MGMRQYSAKMFFFSLFANFPSFLKKLDLFIVATVLRVNNHSSVYLNIGFFSATQKIYIFHEARAVLQTMWLLGN